MSMKPFLPLALLSVSLASLPRPALAQEDKPVRALLVIGGCCHDYKAQQKIITEGVSARANVEWTISYDPDKGTQHKNPVYDNPDWAKNFDVVVHDECTAGVTDVPFITDRVLKPHRDGLPAVVLHCGMHSYRSDGFPDATPWFEFTGLRSTGHGPQQPIAVRYVDKEHPITKGLADWTTINEELYNNLQLLDTAHALARGRQTVRQKNGRETTEDAAVAWTNVYNGKTRVFATTLGHNNETVADARHLDLVTRGLLWSVDKLDDKHLKPAKKVLSGDGPKAGPVRENLAQGKAATASSAQDASRAAGGAVDGDESTRWCAANDTAPQWLQVDLGSPQDVTGCRITWEFDETPYRHKVETSADGKTWSVAVDRTGNPANKQAEENNFTAKGVRYVRVAITGLKPVAWASVYELEVFGTRMIQPVTLTPEEQRQAAARRIAKTLKAPEGFELSVFAVPPDVNYPTVVAATPAGELFVGIDEMGSLGRKAGRGRVVRCADRDGDGVAEEFKTFAAMDHPRGLAWDGAASTLYVLHPPFLTAYADDNGDGVADRSKVLVQGITNEKIQAERGADHTTNGIRLGIDGWIYIAMGDFGCVAAAGADGRTLQMHGGGVVRVRPDGAGLEAYTRGQRNIYDVAIDPFMNAFTRDNTNDGDGWDVRLSQIVPTGDYGYPRLFKNFPDEIVKPMMELGGGSPCGSLYVDEPGLPADAGRMLYTVEWGRNGIMRHPLKPSGAGFTAAEEKWMDLPRGTDMDVDGQGRIYVSSWANGGFDYSGPDVGYVVRLTPSGRRPAPLPDLKKAGDDDLVTLHLASPSAVLRLAAQREILKRSGTDGSAFVGALTNLATSGAPLEARAAAVLTLSQLAPARARADLATLASKDDLREFVLRGLADRRGDGAAAEELFAGAAGDRSARVRLAAAWGLGRVGGPAAADALVRLVGDEDPLVAHVAANSLVRLRAYDACAKALDASTPRLVAGAARALQGMHETPVVELLTGRLATQQDAAVRAAVYRTLCRLAYREADWDGGWWGTRPDTSGPYYSQGEWEGTARVKEALRAALKTERPEVLRTLVLDLRRHKIDLPEAGPVVARLAQSDASFRQVVIDLLASKPRLNADDVALLRPVALSKDEPAPLRAKAVRLLARDADDVASLDVVVEALAAAAAAEPAAEELRSAYNDITRDRRLARKVDYFETLAKSDSPARRALAQAVLRNVKPDAPKPAGKAIGAMGYEDVLVAVTAAKGKAANGAAVFTKAGCVACHTVSASEPPKGPFLGGIAARYNRAELCESVLKPGAKISQGFETQWFKPAKGDVVEGFVTRESGDEIELRNVNGETLVLKKETIQRRGKRDTSTMPEGMAANLTPEELADLLAYLESLQGK
jgi:putative heme-binding domain-containing protein